MAVFDLGSCLVREGLAFFIAYRNEFVELLKLTGKMFLSSIENPKDYRKCRQASLNYQSVSNDSKNMAFSPELSYVLPSWDRER